MGAWQPKLPHWAGLSFPAYNGGLFAADPALDALHVTDAVCASFKDRVNYEYRPNGGATWSSTLADGLLPGTGPPLACFAPESRCFPRFAWSLGRWRPHSLFPIGQNRQNRADSRAEEMPGQAEHLRVANLVDPDSPAVTVGLWLQQDIPADQPSPGGVVQRNTPPQKPPLEPYEVSRNNFVLGTPNNGGSASEVHIHAVCNRGWPAGSPAGWRSEFKLVGC